MKKWLIIVCCVCLGTFLMAQNESEMDLYYSELDETSSLLAAHGKIDNNKNELLRKRAYKRKRIRRPPRWGK
tara:strand:+ start:759 stop:974 length:216 start_codon:yes stop_codon:yes gene_type:complete